MPNWHASIARPTAFVFPSLYEGFGIPPLEAQACGCPVISANTASMPEVLQDSVLYFDPYETASITQAMRTILQDAPLREALRARAWPTSSASTGRPRRERSPTCWTAPWRHHEGHGQSRLKRPTTTIQRSRTHGRDKQRHGRPEPFLCTPDARRLECVRRVLQVADCHRLPSSSDATAAETAERPENAECFETPATDASLHKPNLKLHELDSASDEIEITRLPWGYAVTRKTRTP